MDKPYTAHCFVSSAHNQPAISPRTLSTRLISPRAHTQTTRHFTTHSVDQTFRCIYITSCCTIVKRARRDDDVISLLATNAYVDQSVEWPLQVELRVSSSWCGLSRRRCIPCGPAVAVVYNFFGVDAALHVGFPRLFVKTFSFTPGQIFLYPYLYRHLSMDDTLTKSNCLPELLSHACSYCC